MGPTKWSNLGSRLNFLKEFKVTSFNPNLMRIGNKSTNLDSLDEIYPTIINQNRQRKKSLKPTSKGDEKTQKNP